MLKVLQGLKKDEMNVSVLLVDLASFLFKHFS